MADQETILEVFEALESAGYKTPPAWDNPRKLEMGLRVYLAVFRDISNEDALAAVLAYVESGEKFWPVPGILKKHTAASAVEDIDTSDEAWGETIKALGSRGRNRPPGEGWDFDGTMLHREACRAGIAAAGGWRSLSMQDESSMAPERAAFRSAYRAVTKRQKVAAQHESITAFLEARPRLMLAD
jgi:hypothetical protein